MDIQLHLIYHIYEDLDLFQELRLLCKFLQEFVLQGTMRRKFIWHLQV